MEAWFAQSSFMFKHLLCCFTSFTTSKKRKDSIMSPSYSSALQVNSPIHHEESVVLMEEANSYNIIIIKPNCSVDVELMRSVKLLLIIFL